MRRPTAAQRTISMFTGRTDLDGELARDGSQGQPVGRPPRITGKSRWKPDQGSWFYFPKGFTDRTDWKHTRGSISPLKGDRWRAYPQHGATKDFDRLMDAAAYVEASERDAK